MQTSNLPLPPRGTFSAEWKLAENGSRYLDFSELEQTNPTFAPSKPRLVLWSTKTETGYKLSIVSSTVGYSVANPKEKDASKKKYFVSFKNNNTLIISVKGLTETLKSPRVNTYKKNGTQPVVNISQKEFSKEIFSSRQTSIVLMKELLKELERVFSLRPIEDSTDSTDNITNPVLNSQELEEQYREHRLLSTQLNSFLIQKIYPAFAALNLQNEPTPVHFDSSLKSFFRLATLEDLFKAFNLSKEDIQVLQANSALFNKNLPPVSRQDSSQLLNLLYLWGGILPMSMFFREGKPTYAYQKIAPIFKTRVEKGNPNLVRSLLQALPSQIVARCVEDSLEQNVTHVIGDFFSAIANKELTVSRSTLQAIRSAKNPLKNPPTSTSLRSTVEKIVSFSHLEVILTKIHNEEKISTMRTYKDVRGKLSEQLMLYFGESFSVKQPGRSLLSTYTLIYKKDPLYSYEAPLLQMHRGKKVFSFPNIGTSFFPKGALEEWHDSLKSLLSKTQLKEIKFPRIKRKQYHTVEPLLIPSSKTKLIFEKLNELEQTISGLLKKAKVADTPENRTKFYVTVYSFAHIGLRQGGASSRAGKKLTLRLKDIKTVFSEDYTIAQMLELLLARPDLSAAGDYFEIPTSMRIELYPEVRHLNNYLSGYANFSPQHSNNVF